MPDLLSVTSSICYNVKHIMLYRYFYTVTLNLREIYVSSCSDTRVDIIDIGTVFYGGFCNLL